MAVKTFFGFMPFSRTPFLKCNFIGGPDIGLSESVSLRIFSNFFLMFFNLFSLGLPKDANLAIESAPKSSESYQDKRTWSLRSSETRPSTSLLLPLKETVNCAIPLTVIGVFEALNNSSESKLG